MSNKDIDKIFHDKLSQYQTPVDAGVWGAIESSLDNTKAAPVIGNGRWGKVRKVIGYAATVAALLVIGLFLAKNTNEPEIKPESIPYTQKENSNLVAILDANPSEPNKQQPIEKTTAVSNETAIGKGWEKSDEYMVDCGIAQTQSLQDAQVIQDEQSIENIQDVQIAQNDQNMRSHKSEQNIQAFEYGKELLADGIDVTKKSKVSSFTLSSNVVAQNGHSSFGHYSGTMASSSISHSNRDVQNMEIISDVKHSLPLNLGVKVDIKLNSKVSLGTGLTYTWLRSRYEGLINKKHHRIKQSLHYVGVPVNVYFTMIGNGKLKVYANAGAAIEKGIRASYRITSYDGTSFTSNAKMDGLQFSVNGGLGLEYRFSKPFGVYLEPNAVYFFDSKVPASIRTDQPLQLRAEIGFKLYL